jgi:hypothetical protein
MFDLKRYSSNIQTILGPHEGGQRLMPLAPREPCRGPGLEFLTAAAPRTLFSDVPVVSEEYAQCLKSTLFLYFSALAASHEIAQTVHSSTGSLLHGIMHRQEPDFGNSKYWFRRVATHDIYPLLREASLELLQGLKGSPAADLLGPEVKSSPRWDPQWFVDQCEAAHGGASEDYEQRLLEIQRLEWQILFDYCYQKATGTD